MRTFTVQELLDFAEWAAGRANYQTHETLVSEWLQVNHRKQHPENCRILKYKYKDEVHFYNENEKNWFTDDMKQAVCAININSFLNIGDITIIVIKRNSDGVNFRLGDGITYLKDQKVLYARIKHFVLDDKKIKCTVESNTQAYMRKDIKQDYVALEDIRPLEEWENKMPANAIVTCIDTSGHEDFDKGLVSFNEKAGVFQTGSDTTFYYPIQDINRPGRIYSVRRKSDGVNFKIGDGFVIVGDKRTRGKIESFYIAHKMNNIVNPNEVIVKITDNSNLCFSEVNLNDILPVLPIAKTFDGKDIFEGDFFYAVKADFTLVTSPIFASYTEQAESLCTITKYNSGGWFLFLDEKQAGDFFNKHQVKYSRADIERLFINSGQFASSGLRRELHKLEHETPAPNGILKFNDATDTILPSISPSRNL